MTDTGFDRVLEDVLLAFSVEPAHDRATLERYLKRYPQYAADLIDLLRELRQSPAVGADISVDEAAAKRAWDAFADTTPRTADEPVSDPFAAFHGVAFATLAQTLRVPRSVLIAIRDRLVIVATIPGPFIARLIRATRSTAETFERYLALPPVVAPAASYKADRPPEAPGKVDFEVLLDNSGVTADQKRDIYTSTS